MKVNIVCTDVGWVYSKFIAMFRQYSKHQILLNQQKTPHVVTHYLPYYETPATPEHPSTAWLSHQETKRDLYDKFVTAAKDVDFGISHSKKYAELLRNAHGVTSVKQVLPGVDLYRFPLRSSVRPPKDKLVVGYVGRQYTSSNRKNPQLLNKISQLPFVELKVTGGKIKEERLPQFYAGLDLVISPATIEGGPMALQEGLATGVPFLCFASVGTASEFKEGVFTVPLQNDAEFIKMLKKIWDEEVYKEYWEPHKMRQLRAQIEPFTWQRFVEEHDRIWESIV